VSALPAFNRLPQMGGALRAAMADVIEETASNIAANSHDTVFANSRRTGRLAGSVRKEIDGLTAMVGYDDFKAVWIEYGTGQPGPTDAAPFLTPAAEAERAAFAAKMTSLDSRLAVNAAGSTGLTAMAGLTFSAREMAPQGAKRRPRARR
jgi:hypothetical protein